MWDAKLIEAPRKPPRTIQQVELVPRPAVDIESFQLSEIVAQGFHGDDRVVAHPICPPLLDHFAGVCCDRKPHAQKFSRIGVVTRRHGQHVHYGEVSLWPFPGFLQLTPPALDRVVGAGQRPQHIGHIGQVAQLEPHIAGMTRRGRPHVGMA